MTAMMSRRADTRLAAGRQYRSAAPDHRADLKRVAQRRPQVKVSDLMSPESRLAIMMVQKDTVQERQQTRNKATAKKDEGAAVITPASQVRKTFKPPPNSAGDDSRSSYTTTTTTDTTTDTTTTTTDNTLPGFAEALERICTLRLPGDITDKNYTPRKAKKRALRHGEHLHNAMEVVEIVRHVDCDDAGDDDNESDEEEALHRATTISSLERCTAWVEMHFSGSTEDTSEISTDR